MGYNRDPAVAGSFYPANPDELRNMLEKFLREAATDSPPPRAMIVPHAGYIYSGPVAATGYARLKNNPATVRRVILLGPSHRVPLRGIAVTTAESYTTPLGRVCIDQLSLRRLATLPQVTTMDEAHRFEHSLEVHLPFLQITLGDFELIPLVVGIANAEEVCEILELLWQEPDTLVVISSDLSHYHDYDTARRLDSATSRHIEMLEYDAIDPGDACGCVPVSGLLLYARRHGLTVTTADLRNSGDTAGPRDQVVGYGTYVFQ